MTKILDSFTLDVKQNSEYWRPILTNMNKETMQKRFFLFAIEEIKKSLSISATHVNQFSFDSLIEDFNKDSMVKIASNDINSDLFLKVILENFKGCKITLEFSESESYTDVQCFYNEAQNSKTKETYIYCFSSKKNFMDNYVTLKSTKFGLSEIPMKLFLSDYNFLPANTLLCTNEYSNRVYQYYILPENIDCILKEAPYYVTSYLNNYDFDEYDELGLKDYYGSNGERAKKEKNRIVVLKSLGEVPYVIAQEESVFNNAFNIINLKDIKVGKR